jgi:hypothetical protein
VRSYKLWVEVDGDLYAGPIYLAPGEEITVVVPDFENPRSVELAAALRRETDRANDLAHRVWALERSGEDE